MAIPPSGKTEMIAANRARAAANRETRRGEKKTTVEDKKTGVNKKSKSLRYPYAMLKDSTDYLRMEIAEYVPPQLNLSNVLDNVAIPGEIDVFDNKGNKTGTKPGKVLNTNFSLQQGSKTQTFSGPNKKIESTIYLPIPQQLSDSTSVSWGDGGLNPVEAFGVAATAGLMTGDTTAVEALMSSNTLKTLGNEQFRKAVIAALAGEAVGTLSGNVSGSQLVSRATGQVFNPNLELLFEGVNIRSFPFSFEFFPRNQREAKEVMDIIRTLKIAMSARKTGDTGEIFISAPRVFQLTYMKGGNKHPFLNTFLPMALTSVNLSYTGSNTYSTFHDGTPTHIRMDLTFKELNPVYAEDYDEKNAKIGVGY
jgi:hypothetical protein